MALTRNACRCWPILDKLFHRLSWRARRALAGFVIVALSIELNHSLKFPHLQSRAGGRVGSLIFVLIAAAGGLLVPGCDGFSWIATRTFTASIFSATNAWVVLTEILG